MAVKTTINPGGRLAAVTEAEIACGDMQGIFGGCTILTRNGYRVVLKTETLTPDPGE